MYNTKYGHQISLRLVYLNHMQYIWMKKKKGKKRPQHTKGLPKKGQPQTWHHLIFLEAINTKIEVAGSATLCGLTLKCGVARLHAKYNNFCQTVNYSLHFLVWRVWTTSNPSHSTMLPKSLWPFQLAPDEIEVEAVLVELEKDVYIGLSIIFWHMGLYITSQVAEKHDLIVIIFLLP